MGAVFMAVVSVALAALLVFDFWVLWRLLTWRWG